MAANTRLDKAIIKTLVEIRHEQNLTQIEVGKRVRQPQQVVSKIENGHRRLYAAQLFDYVKKAYGLSPVQFARKLEKNL